jgi:Domain of unknown function (DUF4129)
VGAESAGRLADLPVPQHDPAQARDAADRILADGRYQWEDADDGNSPLDGVARWIADRLDQILPNDLPGMSGGSLPTGVGYVVLGLLVALVLFLVWRARRSLAPRGRERTDADVVIDAGEEDHDWLAEALAYEDAGDWRSGLRCRYRALVSELAAADLIPDLVGRTAGEFVSDVRRTCPAAGRSFRAATDEFEAAWYGGRAGGPAERDAFEARAAEVRAAAAAPSTAPAEGERELVAPS